MRFGIIGLGHAYKKQKNAINYFKDFEITSICDKNKNLLKKEEDIVKKRCYKNLSAHCDIVLIASPPKTHFKIAKYFIRKKKTVLLEKPVVINIKQLNKLFKIISNSNSNFFNTIHFAYGDEILWWKKNRPETKPIKIVAYISDKYVDNCKILPSAKELNGSYLDETINPLSAIASIYGTNIKACGLERKYFSNSKEDYYSYGKFLLDEILISIEVDWNKNMDEKFIDLIFENEVIRLDSKNQIVKNLTSDQILYKSYNDRMTNHYINSFADFLSVKDNRDFCYKIHKALLENL